MAAIFQPSIRTKVSSYEGNDSNPFINVNIPERILSVAAGTFLAYSGVKNLVHSPIGSVTKTLTGGLLLFRGLTGHCPIYSERGTNTNKIENINIKSNFTVNRPRVEVYQFWRRLENLPLFMRHLERVEQTDDRHSHWVAKIPGNLGTISWNAEIVEDKDFFIGWQSVEGSDIFNAGKVEFKDAPQEQGTEIQAVISYKAPAGAFGTQVAKLLNPAFENFIREDVRNFKQFIEAGEIPTIEGQSSGRRSGISDLLKSS
jgi:uncharacterized membrane protein